MHMASPLQKKYLALSCLLLFLLFLIPGSPVSGDVIKPSRYSANTVRGYNESDPGIYDQNHQFLVSSGQNQSNTDTMAGINTTIIPANSSQIKLLQSAWIRKDAGTLTHFLNQAAKAAGISSLFTSTMILPDEVVLQKFPDQVVWINESNGFAATMGRSGLITILDTTSNVSRLEMIIQSGNDSQLATVDMQNALQKQQQTVQMVKTITDLIDNTSSAILHKLKD